MARQGEAINAAQRLHRAALLLGSAALLAACATSPSDRDGPPLTVPAGLANLRDAEPKVEPIRNGGPNKPYRALGRDYVPLTRDVVFRQRGLASWYGRKFHGRPTASGEVYDMFAMTAAHPTLPIPSYAHISNPANGRSVVVRVNDRGPFHAGRIVDLSYAAAWKLDLLAGVAAVELERITFSDIRDGSWRRWRAGASAAAPGLDAGPRHEQALLMAERLHCHFDQALGSGDHSAARLVRQPGGEGFGRDGQPAADGFQARFLACPAGEEGEVAPCCIDLGQGGVFWRAEVAPRQRHCVGHDAKHLDVDADLAFGGDRNHRIVLAVAEVEGTAHGVAQGGLTEWAFGELQVLRRNRAVLGQQLAQGRVRSEVAAPVAFEDESGGPVQLGRAEPGLHGRRRLEAKIDEPKVDAERRGQAQRIGRVESR